IFSPTDPSLALLAVRGKAGKVPDAAFAPAFKVTRAAIRAAKPLGARLAATSPGLPPRRRDTADDEYLWNQGPTQGLGKVVFHDWRAVYADWATL
ncbi:hypothetical protein, partial [Nocardioides sp. GCM10030258]